MATVEALKSLKYASQNELAAGLGVSKGTVSKRLQRAIALGHITEDGVKHFLGKASELRQGDSIELDVDPDEDDGEPDEF